ncbi:hypothetical protein [Streptomyces sp. NBC_01481]|uniref:hypothetical protein n=1 Tax=Streptomyces sp. NBC_01481 TaxID=2975869 RepID=UPI00224FBF2A|nr:hypothetical protein [Streptomyces sp. NBC_01481]MCX4587032.1 hypothetical protein [Streptomyces sp. NBC_01481]
MGLLLAEDALVGLRLRRRQVMASVTVMEDEARRRSEVGLGAVDSRSLLRLLYELPVGIPVPLRAFDTYDLRALREAPRGVVDLDEARDVVVRRVAPVARVELVLLHGHVGDEVVGLASQFGPFCARGAVIPEAVPGEDADFDLLLLKARFYGVGVALDGRQGLRWLMKPARFRPQRHSAAQWLLHEQAWRQLGPGRS